MMPLVMVAVKKQVAFECGCLVEFPVLGNFSEREEWHVIPCREHTQERPGVEAVAETEWNRIVEKASRPVPSNGLPPSGF